MCLQATYCKLFGLGVMGGGHGEVGSVYSHLLICKTDFTIHAVQNNLCNWIFVKLVHNLKSLYPVYYVYTHTCTRAHTHTHTHRHTHTHAHTHSHTHMPAHTHVCAHTHTCTHSLSHTHVCVHTRTHTHTHTHMYTPTPHTQRLRKN